jgi:hypothetical protein
MNKLVVVTSLTVMIFASSCATNKDQANNKLNIDNDSDVLSNSSDSSKPEKYVQVIDELISNGCNISTFELINRKNTLEMKVSCK